MRLTTISQTLPRLFPRLALHALLLAVVLVARPAPAAEGLPYGQGLFWKLERGGAAPSYLLGTMHVTDGRVLDLPPEVRQPFDRAGSATFEVLMTDDVQGSMAQAMIFTDGRTLDGVLGPELFARAAEAAAAYGMAPKDLRYFRPWALTMIFSVPLSEFGRLAAGDQALDDWLQSEAGRQGKKLLQLETIDEQIATFNGLSEADQVALLDVTIGQNAEIDVWFKNILERYLARDVSAIYAQMTEQSTAMNPDLATTFQSRFIDQRNQRMATRMAPQLAEGNAFVAVGALHLPGEQGILRLLERQGYRVTRVY